MIISHKYKFIFIKTLKTAGTSIEIFLSQYCGDDDIVTPISTPIASHQPRNYKGMIWNPLSFIIDNQKNCGLRSTLKNMQQGRRFFNHMSAHSVKRLIPNDIWDNYFSFCVERNPWDKTLSHYHMVNKRAKRTLSFDQYLDQKQFCLNYPMYMNTDGEMVVDQVIRYESLAADLAKIFDTLGIPFDGDLGVRAKSRARQDKRPYHQVYTDAQRALIEKVFASEIELHGYTY